MADGDNAATGAGDAGTSTDPAKGAGQQQQQQSGAGQASGGTQTPKTFTQDQLNDLLAKERATTEKRFADYDDVKQRAAEFDKLTDAAKTELERAKDTAAASERRALQLETDLADSRLRSAVITAAARKGIVDPGDAFKLLDRSQVTFDKAGDPQNIDALLDDLVKSKPYLSAKPGNGSGEGGPRGGSTQGDGMTKNEWFHQVAGGRRQ